MRRAYVTAILVYSVMLTVGCAPANPLAKYHLGPAKQIVGTCLSTMGGLNRWESVSHISADAVVSRYDTNGRTYVNRLKLDMDVPAGSIDAIAQTGTGRWTASADKAGRCKLSVTGGGPDVRSDLIGKMLGRILHRACGPMNLLAGGERVSGTKRANLGGHDVVRVGVTGASGQAVAYYFDATSGLLRYVTSGADKPGRGGTITIYEYMMLPDGLAFPKRIRIVEIGQRAMISRRNRLEVEFSNVAIR